MPLSPPGSPIPVASLRAYVPTAVSRTNYSAYKFRAEIDWIELRLEFTAPTNFDTVRRRLGSPFAEPFDEGAGHAATIFNVKIHSPQSWDNLELTLIPLIHDHPLKRAPVVTGIEVALDAYSKASNRDELVDMVCHFYRGAQKLVSANRRLYRTKKDPVYGITDLRNLRKQIAEGYNINVGSRGDSDAVIQHGYVKDTDGAGNVLLPANEHRARFEFTLLGTALPHTSLSAWRRHKFTEMADFFKFRQLKSKTSPSTAVAFANLAQIGERLPPKSGGRGRRVFSKATEADVALNQLSYDALRELTRRMKAAETS
jgi:hypothetical protein